MRRFLSGAVVAAVAATGAGAGCGEDSAQHAARVAVQEHAGGATTHCTRNAREYFRPVDTSVYICIVERDDGRCDEYVATRGARRFAVRLRRRAVDCLLPTG